MNKRIFKKRSKAVMDRVLTVPVYAGALVTYADGVNDLVPVQPDEGWDPTELVEAPNGEGLFAVMLRGTPLLQARYPGCGDGLQIEYFPAVWAAQLERFRRSTAIFNDAGVCNPTLEEVLS